MRLRNFALACALAVLSAAPALAVPVTYEFAGTSSGLEPLGNYFHDFGVPLFTPLSGQITLESDTLPYYEDASQKNFFDVVTSMNVQFGAGGTFGTYTGPSGLQVPPPNGWNSSSMGLSTGFYNDGTPYDQVAIYGSLAGQPGDAANVYYRFELWGVSSLNVFDTFPSLDQLPNKNAFGPLPMGFNLVATQYDNAGLWLGQTTLHANLSSFSGPNSVPEPGTWGLFVAGLFAMFVMRRSRRLR
jgi:hypothetical protein